VVSSTPRPHFAPEKDPIPILQEASCITVKLTNAPLDNKFFTIYGTYQPTIGTYP